MFLWKISEVYVRSPLCVSGIGHNTK